MAIASGGPSGALGLGLGHGGAAVCSDRVHGGTAAHSALGGACCSDETVVGGGSTSLVMVLGFKAMWKHTLEGDDVSSQCHTRRA